MCCFFLVFLKIYIYLFKQNDNDDRELNDNFNFLTGEIKSRPRGDYIDNILKEWKGDYEKLERHHGYIQWLFPIRTQGMNYESHPLQIHELIVKFKFEFKINFYRDFVLFLRS